MSVPIELVPVGNATTNGMVSVTWSAPGAEPAGDLRSNIDPWFSTFGDVSDLGVSVARLAVGVFVADRMSRRNKLKLRREIDLQVWVPNPTLISPALSDFEDLLTFLTGDAWHLSVVADTTPRAAAQQTLQATQQVSLLSGGLDSYCGALINGPANRMFLSHSDSPVVTNSQNRTFEALSNLGLTTQTVRLSVPRHLNREASRRSRSFLFIGLAVALADAVGATLVEVPENGFTSLNPPLAANRNGVWTTRSTHPWTFARLGTALASAGVSVQIANPYEWMTKGELVAAAVAATSVADVQRGLESTLSCAKSNPILHNSGFGRNCGLDYSCIVRRGAALAASVPDTTNYLRTDPNVNHAQLIDIRRNDIAAVELALRRSPDPCLSG